MTMLLAENLRAKSSKKKASQKICTGHVASYQYADREGQAGDAATMNRGCSQSLLSTNCDISNAASKAKTKSATEE